MDSLKQKAHERLDTAIRTAAGELRPEEVLAADPDAVTGAAERRMLILMAMGEIGMAHHLALLSDSERDDWLRRLPPLPAAE